MNIPLKFQYFPFFLVDIIFSTSNKNFNIVISHVCSHENWINFNLVDREREIEIKRKNKRKKQRERERTVDCANGCRHDVTLTSRARPLNERSKCCLA